MIPYLQLPHWRIGSISVSLPLAFAGAGILVAHFLLLRRARRHGLNPDVAAAMSLTMVLAGAIGAYWFRGFYFADAVKRDWHMLLHLQYGAASFGGISIGLLAGWAYLALRRLTPGHTARYLDALAYVFPKGWILGRCGCILAHDHPGRLSNSLLAVRYPGAPRFDLAVLEVIFLAAVLIPLFAFLDLHKRRPGFWLALFLTVYGAFRLCLDTLHVDPPRYGPLSVDQWAYGLVLLLGVAFLIPHLRRSAIE